MNNPLILTLETVFDQCSIALSQSGVMLSEQTQTGKREQTQQILPMIDEILTKNQIKFTDLTAIAFNRGPGAFSGIRINTAVAQALAFAHDLPCLPVSSLQAVAQQAFVDKGLTHVYAVIDARMNQVYFGEFVLKDDIMQAVNDNTERLLDYDEKTEQNLPLVGDGANLLSTQENQQIFNDITPTAKTLAILGEHLYKNNGAVTAENALPVYLRHNAWKTLAEQKASH